MRLKQRVETYIRFHGLYDIYKNTHSYQIVNVDKNKKKAFFLMLPNYGNLGDQAIAVYTSSFIKKYFPDYELLTFDEEDTYKNILGIKAVCSSNDIIFIQGGGNMGNIYPNIEYLRQFCIKEFPDNVVISMPTTIKYTDNKEGTKALIESKKIYDNKDNLILFAREKLSYNRIREYYPNARVMLCPDIVLSMGDLERKQYHRKNDSIPIVCLRKELESALSEDERDYLISCIVADYPESFIFDTEVKRTISSVLREIEVKSIIKQFGRASFVVTDRMHGMIFSAITGTPCLVFKSMDEKITGTYDWIKDRKNIVLHDKNSTDTLQTLINSIQKTVDESSNGESLSEYGSMMAKYIYEVIDD